jgi:hypothetical protein
MTPPQDLADRLEKEIEDFCFYNQKDPEIHPNSGTLAEIIREKIADIVLESAFDLLASLRRSAPASGEMGEAKENEWNKLVHDFVCHAVNSWQWLSNAHTGIAKPGAADVISVHNDLHSLMDRWLELRQRGTQFARTPSGETGEEAGS